MAAYIVRRLLLGIPIVIGALILLFIVFFAISNPDEMAKQAIGEKAKEKDIMNWKKNQGYAFTDKKMDAIIKQELGDKPEDMKEEDWQEIISTFTKENVNIPNFYNKFESGLTCFSETTFYSFMSRMMTFNFGKSDYDNQEIWVKIRQGIVPSLVITVPIFIFGLIFSVFISMLAAMFRKTYIDNLVLIGCIAGMSIVYFLYIIGLQFVMAKVLKWYPISGWSDNYMTYFAFLPIIIGLIATIGESTRFYRTIMINEINADYVRTARAKGLGDLAILYKHLLKNAMIPILTRVIMALPFLVTGSLLLESFFGIPGLGRMTVDAIYNSDLPTLSSVAFLSSIIYVIANIISDISYTFVDPRVRLS
jgi:peptide/nickel transport system permease protein